jgi:hypothetical protein
LSRFGSDAYKSSLRDFLRTKYADKKIDVAVAVMAPAFEFLSRYGELIFPGTPIVFCGLDRKQLGSRPLPSNWYGVIIKRNLRRRSRLYFVSIPKPGRLWSFRAHQNLTIQFSQQHEMSFGPMRAKAGSRLHISRICLSNHCSQYLRTCLPTTSSSLRRFLKMARASPSFPTRLLNAFPRQQACPCTALPINILDEGLLGEASIVLRHTARTLPCWYCAPCQAALPLRPSRKSQATK